MSFISEKNTNNNNTHKPTHMFNNEHRERENQLDTLIQKKNLYEKYNIKKPVLK